MMQMLLQVTGAFLAVVTLSVMFGVPGKFIIYSGLGGAVGWMIYLIGMYMGTGIVMATFIAALFAALTAHTCARLLKSPVTVFLIPGILPLVPGLGMYRIAYNIVNGDTKQAGFYFLQTMEIAGMIALAIFIMDSAFRMFQDRRGKRGRYLRKQP